MNVAIIEDERLSADRLEEMLTEIDPSITVQARLSSVEESVRWLSSHAPDLIFLDIHLSDGVSFTIFDSVEVRCPIIFTTAYDQYAVKAFKVNSIDYLLKPVDQNELRESLRKFRSLTAGYRPDIDALIRSLQPGGSGYKQRFLIQYGETIRTVPTEEIAYFYALEKNVFAATRTKHHYPVDQSLDALETMLDPVRFFRINRKMIIAIDAIAKMVPYSRSRIRIDLIPEAPAAIEALVSVERASRFREWADT